MLYTKPRPSWLSALALMSGVWVSGLCFLCVALGFPWSLGFLPKIQGGVWCFGPGVSLLYPPLDLPELLTPSGVPAGLCPSPLAIFSLASVSALSSVPLLTSSFAQPWSLPHPTNVPVPCLSTPGFMDHLPSNKSGGWW